MNSEELERSLRAEFENYLKGVLSGIRQDVFNFKRNFDAELEKHRAQMDEAVRALASRFESEVVLDKAFTQSVIEHLKLARDEGAEIAATAFGEAEKLRKESAPVAARYDQIRDAITEISAKNSQATILTALVENVAQFVPRGAFFIVRNDRFVCWKAFGAEAPQMDDARLREVNIPVSRDTILAAAVQSLETRKEAFGAHSDDGTFLGPLGFGKPDRMFVVPLVARGRGVAALYADYGTGGVDLNIEAVEALVRIAGMTVELHAASQTASTSAAQVVRAPSGTPADARAAAAQRPGDHTRLPVRDAKADYVKRSDHRIQPAAETQVATQAEEFKEYTGAVTVEEVAPQRSYDSEAETAQAYTEAAGKSEHATYFEPVTPGFDQKRDVETPQVGARRDFAFGSGDSYDASHSQPPLKEVSLGTGASGVANGQTYQPSTQPTVETAGTPSTPGRLSDRNVDLPIDVPESERKLHNDARRFARLLVSEIKLYNEQKVNEGREAGDLYPRLREAIDRSREMYDKRVQPLVASKFDYFHYELVNSLAAGDTAKMGGGYPGPLV